MMGRARDLSASLTLAASIIFSSRRRLLNGCCVNRTSWRTAVLRDTARLEGEAPPYSPRVARISASMCPRYFSSAFFPAAVREYSVRGMRPWNDLVHVR